MLTEKNQIVLVGEKYISDEDLVNLKNKIAEKWPDGVPQPIIIIGFHTAFKI